MPLSGADLERLRRQIADHTFLLGTGRRRFASRELASHPSPPAVPLLVEALRDDDEQVRNNAQAGLRALSDPAAVDAFCEAWAKERRPEFEQVLVACGYLARQPVALRVLTACKLGRVEEATQGGAEVVPALLAALEDRDAQVKATAGNALPFLSDPAAVDAFCEAWAKNRHPQLAQILTVRGYQARKPVALRVLTACKLGRVEQAAAGGAEVIPALLSALEDRDAEVKATAGKALAALSDPAAVDAFCETLIREDRPGLAALARERGWVPADTSRRCLFLLLTDQIEDCCQLDPKCEYLRAEYAQSDETLRHRLRERVLASGDDRLAPALSGAAGLDVTIALHERNRNCAALFSCIESASYRQIVRILDFLAAQRWQPVEEADRLFLSDLQSLRARIREMGDAHADFEGLLADPRLEARATSELRQLAARSDPRSRGSALLTLASRDGAAAADLVPGLLTNTNWELRLAAALAAPHCGSGISGQALAQLLDDRNHWVASAGVQGLVQGLRGFGSVEDLHRLEEARARAEQRLRTAPGQAEQADLVLQLLLTVLRRSIRDVELSLAGEETGGDFDIEILGDH